jgi:hypothetical protein
MASNLIRFGLVYSYWLWAGIANAIFQSVFRSSHHTRQIIRRASTPIQRVAWRGNISLNIIYSYNKSKGLSYETQEINIESYFVRQPVKVHYILDHTYELKEDVISDVSIFQLLATV